MSQKSPIEHVAIIMDGNGRWAKARKRSRVWGHIRGSFIISDIVKESRELGVKALTLFAFSTENWSRPSTEIKVLFKLLKKFLLRESSRIKRESIKFDVLGDYSTLNEDTKELIHILKEETKNNTGLKLSFAFGYGGRKEILDAVNKHISEKPGEKINESTLINNLYSPELGDVDLLIRTGGDNRISNFLLWEIAYAELYFTNTKWPDFSRKEFRNIYESVAQRERRFGQVHGNTEYAEVTKLAQQHKEELRVEGDRC